MPKKTEMEKVKEERSKMREYSRILIEKYCMDHSKTKKSAILWDLVELSYTMECEPTEQDAIELEKIMMRERNPELLEALKDLDEFLFG